MNRPKYICADSIPWMADETNGDLAVASIVTSFPDMSELGIKDVGDYDDWLEEAARTAAWAVDEDQFLVCYQADRYVDGTTYSKFRTICMAASLEYHRLVWHAIVRDERHSRYRPSYGHLFALSRKGKRPAGYENRVFDGGQKVYENGTPIEAAKMACGFVSARHPEGRIIDPFCGRGTIVEAASIFGLDALGIDIDQTQIDWPMRNPNLFGGAT